MAAFPFGPFPMVPPRPPFAAQWQHRRQPDWTIAIPLEAWKRESETSAHG